MSHLLFVDISPLAIGIIVAIPVLFLLVAIYQILKKETGLTKILWILVVLFFPYLGAAIYFISRYLDNKKRRDEERIIRQDAERRDLL
ncbi:PLD nuclease N-terminal domain-containing protein [Sphingobacterium chungjuense]|uniref:PLD nuclease N-terminal domain-containing protein n=1 Tax=Sphingobacterium chungjuense TaxID=2675553 RepID=UPI00140912C3|nr:PLD nuclease N-terminal domain-containing protein [Sphingobacterium chungjuense]